MINKEEQKNHFRIIKIEEQIEYQQGRIDYLSEEIECLKLLIKKDN